MPQQNPIQEQIITRAMKDEEFRQELLSNPKEVLERELGIALPHGVTVQVHEDTPTTVHIMLPPSAAGSTGKELSDEELEQATGGVFGTSTIVTRVFMGCV